MTTSAQLGGGYSQSQPAPQPTIEAVLEAATPGSFAARLIIIGGPPGVGKTTLMAGLKKLLPEAFLSIKISQPVVLYWKQLTCGAIRQIKPTAQYTIGKNSALSNTPARWP